MIIHRMFFMAITENPHKQTLTNIYGIITTKWLMVISIYPIDIRELVTYFAPKFEADGITDFHIGVGNKISVIIGLDKEHVLSNTNIVKSKTNVGLASRQFITATKFKIFLMECGYVKYK